MKPISQDIKFEVKQPSLLKIYFELWAGSELLSTLYYPKIFRMHAVIETAAGMWVIKKEHLWKRKLSIFESGKELPVAEFFYHKYFGRDVIEFPSGSRLFVDHKNWSYSYNVFNEDGLMLLGIKRNLRFKEKAEIIINDASKIQEVGLWIMMFAMHIAIYRLHSIKPSA